MRPWPIQAPWQYAPQALVLWQEMQLKRSRVQLPSHQETQRRLIAALNCADKQKLTRDWVLHLHGSYLQRFLADNDRIWSTGSLFVPLSLVTFPAFFALEDPSVWHAPVFSGVSLALLSFWLYVARGHKAFQNRSHDMVRALETYIVGMDQMTEIREALAGRSPKTVSIGRVRGFLLSFVAIGWGLVVLLVLTDAF